MSEPHPDTLRETLQALAREHLSWEGPLPAGDLAQHMDSMQRLALVVAIEDHFQVAFDPEDDESARTLDDVERLLRAKLAEAAGA